MSKFYLQITDGIITDAITFPHGDYVEHEAESLPRDILGGWHKYVDGEIVECLELRPKEPEDIQKQIDDLNIAMAAILGGAV